MNEKKVMKFIGFNTVAIIIAIGFQLTLTNAQTEHGDHEQMNMVKMSENTGAQVKQETVNLEKIHSENMPLVLQTIEKAIKAIQAGNSNDALVELAKAKTMIATIDKVVSQYITPKFVNNKCPIMGTTIEPENVTEDLIREYKGQKVAFCCKMCPAEWDKLSDAEKEAKLSQVKI